MLIAISIILIIFGIIYLFFGGSFLDIILSFIIASFSFFKNWIQHDISYAKMSFHNQFIKQLKLDFPIIHFIEKAKKNKNQKK